MKGIMISIGEAQKIIDEKSRYKKIVDELTQLDIEIERIEAEIIDDLKIVGSSTVRILVGDTYYTVYEQYGNLHFPIG